MLRLWTFQNSWVWKYQKKVFSKLDSLKIPAQPVQLFRRNLNRFSWRFLIKSKDRNDQAFQITSEDTDTFKMAELYEFEENTFPKWPCSCIMVHVFSPHTKTHTFCRPSGLSCCGEKKSTSTNKKVKIEKKSLSDIFQQVWNGVKSFFETLEITITIDIILWCKLLCCNKIYFSKPLSLPVRCCAFTMQFEFCSSKALYISYNIVKISPSHLITIVIQCKYLSLTKFL